VSFHRSFSPISQLLTSIFTYLCLNNHHSLIHLVTQPDTQAAVVSPWYICTLSMLMHSHLFFDMHISCVPDQPSGQHHLLKRIPYRHGIFCYALYTSKSPSVLNSRSFHLLRGAPLPLHLSASIRTNMVSSCPFLYRCCSAVSQTTFTPFSSYSLFLHVSMCSLNVCMAFVTITHSAFCSSRQVLRKSPCPSVPYRFHILPFLTWSAEQ
jgi:hypothetical protein